MFEGLPDDHEVVRYFDWTRWTADLEMSYTVEPAPYGGVFIYRDS